MEIGGASRQRLEVAIGEVSALPCPRCTALTFAPGWWCEACERPAYQNANFCDDEDHGDHEIEDHS
jgi:hypothetical protein